MVDTCAWLRVSITSLEETSLACFTLPLFHLTQDLKVLLSGLNCVYMHMHIHVRVNVDVLSSKKFIFVCFPMVMFRHKFYTTSLLSLETTS